MADGPAPAPAPGRAPAPAQGARPRPRRSTVARATAVSVGLAIVVLWIWAFTAGQQPLPDRLDDDAFATAAEGVCEAAQADVAALPPAYEITSAGDRADVVAASNERYLAMVAELAALAPTTGRDGEMVQEWLADWGSYVADRADYAQRLRTDEAARFYVSEKAGDQLTEPVDRFARVNAMVACATPSDLS